MSAALERLVDKIPGNGGWSEETNRQTYLAAAVKLQEAGFTLAYIETLLEALFNAAIDDAVC